MHNVRPAFDTIDESFLNVIDFLASQFEECIKGEFFIRRIKFLFVRVVDNFLT
jgi:hypothetical protein